MQSSSVPSRPDANSIPFVASQSQTLSRSVISSDHQGRQDGCIFLHTPSIWRLPRWHRRTYALFACWLPSSCRGVRMTPFAVASLSKHLRLMIIMSVQDDKPNRSVFDSLEMERQAIFSTDSPIAEQEARWQKRKAEIATYLANDNGAFASGLHDTKTGPPAPENEMQQISNIPSSQLPPKRPSTVSQTYMRRTSTRNAGPSWPLADGRSNSFHGFGQADHRNGIAMPQQSQGEGVFEPEEWLNRLQSTSATTMKRPRLDGTCAAATSSLSIPPMNDQLMSPNSFSMPTPISSVSSGLSAPSFSLSSCSTDSSSFCGGEDMTRQGSSASDMSMTKGFGMMRVDSTHSVDLDVPLFPFSFVEPMDSSSYLSDSMTSGVTEKPASSLRATTASEGSRLRQNDVLENMGSGFDSEEFLSVSPLDFSSPFDFTASGMPWQRIAHPSKASKTPKMERTDSQESVATTSSASSSDAQQRAVMRLNKHISNGHSQTILPKTSPTTTNKPAPKPIASQKFAIPRLPLNLKTKEPLQCHDCEMTLRGHHELQRHWDNIHKPVKSVWICVQPESSPIMPKSPLDICKQCMREKPYNADYNAAAHLKRGHFNPSKRGRKPKGSAPVSRLAKDAGPPIEDLKKYGWLKRIFITNDGIGAVAGNEGGDEDGDGDCDDATNNEPDDDMNDVESPQFSDDTPFPDAASYGQPSSLSDANFPANFVANPSPTPPIDQQQVDYCTQALGFDLPNFQDADVDFSHVGNISHGWYVAPPMEPSLSAPGRLGDGREWTGNGL
ncbi:hypothetical protein Q7P37_009497 [Cladosporium fusiforme]